MAVAYRDAKLGQGPTNGSRIYPECPAYNDEGAAGVVQVSRPTDVIGAEPGIAPRDALAAHVLHNSLPRDAVAPGKFPDLDP
jgi:hypothetical protein